MAEVVEVTKEPYAMERLKNSLLEVVDETLKQVFREAGAKVIYEFLECNYLSREEIAEKPEVFSSGLRSLLGSGALVIEKLVLKKLRSKLGFEEKEGYDFSDYIEEFRERLEE